MDFTVMGTVSSYVKQKNLTFAAKHKIKTGQTLTNANGNFISMTTSTFQKLAQASKTSTDAAKQQKIRRIKQKLHNGQKLSDEELGFLRTNDPKTYKKAKHAQEAREDLKAELKKAKSKSEAREAMTRAMIKASSEAMAELSALGQGGGGSGGFGGGGSADAPQSGAENISGGEVSAGNENISGAEGQTLTEANQSIQASGEKAAGELSESTRENISDAQHGDKTSANKNSSAQKNSSADKNSSAQGVSDSDDMTPEDIMEKYIWTIRALEDEWKRFTDSDEYKDLPDSLIDEPQTSGRKVAVPNQKFFNAVAAYRKNMLQSLGVA